MATHKPVTNELETTSALSPKQAPWPVMVLAHNEERHIAACLDSIFDAEPGRAFDVFVMANGCSDHTEEIVLEYGKRRPGVHLVSIKLGDKCNAWNVFIHETVPSRCPDRDVYFFADGDARFVPGSFSAMAKGLAAEPRAHAASAVPMSGRSGAADRREQLDGERQLLRGAQILDQRLQCLRRNFLRHVDEQQHVVASAVEVTVLAAPGPVSSETAARLQPLDGREEGPGAARARLHVERVRPQRHGLSGSSAEIEPAGISRRRPRQRHHIGVSGSHKFPEGCIRAAVLDEVDEAKPKLGADPSPERRLAGAGRPDQEHHRSVPRPRCAGLVRESTRGWVMCVWLGRHRSARCHQ